jgi:hypothetical protein
MLQEKPPGWAWAAFASAVFQRWAALEERKVAQVVGAPVPPTGRLRTGREVAHFVGAHMRAADDVVAEVADFLRTPAFAAAFGLPGDESTADAEGLLRAAHHLGDRYERLLEVAEDCRRHSVPRQYEVLVKGCTQFVNRHLQDFAGFVDDVLERQETVQQAVLSGQGCEQVEALRLHITTDDRLVWSILDRLQAIDSP